MEKKSFKLNHPESATNKNKADNPPGYTLYPESEDIYEKYKKEMDVNPEDTSKKKVPSGDNTVRQEPLDEKEDLTGKDIDVPGSELDDAEEAVGSEDEENNLYSLGGDNHDN